MGETGFVPVSLFTKGVLWSDDRKLQGGLSQAGYKHLIKTNDLYQGFLAKERRK